VGPPRRRKTLWRRNWPKLIGKTPNCADRIAQDLFGSHLHFQISYGEPDYGRAIKAALFCPAQADQPQLVHAALEERPRWSTNLYYQIDQMKAAR
jgi:hypothetical protein